MPPPYVEELEPFIRARMADGGAPRRIAIWGGMLDVLDRHCQTASFEQSFRNDTEAPLVERLRWDMLRLMAYQWAGHPDWRGEWEPADLIQT